MGGDRRKYVMSLELAMRREMAYREKMGCGVVEKYRSSSVSSTRNGSVPSYPVQAPALIQASRETTTPAVNPNSYPGTPVTAPNPRQHPLTGTRPLIPTPHRPAPDNFIRTSTPSLLPNPRPFPSVVRPSQQAPLQRFSTQHPGPTSISTPPVKPAIQGPLSTLNRPASNSTPLVRPAIQGPLSTLNNPTSISTPPIRPAVHGTLSTLNRRTTPLAHHKRKFPSRHPSLPLKRHQLSSVDGFYCNLCEVDCNSDYNLIMHLRGQKHKAKLVGEQSKRASGGIPGADDKIHCDLCKIWCTDMNAFNAHLNGKNHALKLLATEKKLNCHGGGSAVA